MTMPTPPVFFLARYVPRFYFFSLKQPLKPLLVLKAAYLLKAKCCADAFFFFNFGE